MAKHEFGIMNENPIKSKRYDEYEPKKYELISIDDNYIEYLLAQFNNIPCFWHCLQISQFNLAYCGITLIPPTSLKNFVCVFKSQQSCVFNEVITLFEKAEKNNKFIIHYGI